MCSKRGLSVLADTEDQQENQPKDTAKSLCLQTSTEFAGSPKANRNNVLGDSLSTERRTNISKFKESWLALNKSCMGQSLLGSSEDENLTNSSIKQSSPRTPPAISRPKFQTSRRWNTLMSEESFNSLKRKSPLTSPSIPDKSPRILTSSFNTSRLWSKLRSKESSPTIYNSSPKTSPLVENSNRSPRRLSSSFKTSQRWNNLMSDHLLNESIGTDISHVESLPVIRLVPDQPSQYLPSSSQKKLTPKTHIRAVKGGYADSFQRLMKRARMDQRHLNSREPTHKGHVLAINEEFNVSMALVETENQQGGPSSSFTIILQSNQAKNVEVGSRLQFYLDPNIKPLELSNRQLVYCQPHNVNVL
ncbi:hypothetical protein KR032_003819 [Drosophila birchii]|nr:hypothetical protein KR032_003819 [Drosophila birchii]